MSLFTSVLPFFGRREKHIWQKIIFKNICKYSTQVLSSFINMEGGVEACTLVISGDLSLLCRSHK